MYTQTDVRGAGTLVILVLLCIAVFVTRCDPEEGTIEIRPEPAHAQERVTPQLALARVCASEIGLREPHPRECAAIHQMLLRRAATAYRGSSFEYAAARYSASVFNLERRDTRAYVAHLRPDGREPEGWPESVMVRQRDGTVLVRRHAPWHAFRERWLELYETAGLIIAGEIPSACPEAPDHWGMRSGIDLERALSAGWTEIACTRADGTPTRNAFWRIP
jgi:hypothetical protein